MQESQGGGEPFFPWRGQPERPAPSAGSGEPMPPQAGSGEPLPPPARFGETVPPPGFGETVPSAGAQPAPPPSDVPPWAPTGNAPATPAGPFGPPWGPMGYAAQPPRRRGRQALIYVVVAALAAGAGAGAVLALDGPTSPSANTGVSTAKLPSPSRHAARGGTTINPHAVAAKVEPGIVDINSLLAFQNVPTAATGMVLSASGLVLTNNHVVDGATHIRATSVTSGRTYPVRVIGVDPGQDVALVQLQGATGLRTIPVGNSATVRLGMAVAAIGNAGGKGGAPTVTTGRITSLHRTITASDGGANPETLHGMLQSNASIQPGDSGGAWANSAGQVIAMTTAANTRPFSSAGPSIGFAIPIDRALAIAQQIAAGRGGQGILGGASGVMGVGVGDIGNAAVCLASGRGFSGAPPASSGALVCRAYPGTPAAKAGLATGDVITAVNGQAVTSANSLSLIMRRFRPGDTIAVTWVTTSGQRHTASITLVQGPAK